MIVVRFFKIITFELKKIWTSSFNMLKLRFLALKCHKLDLIIFFSSKVMRFFVKISKFEKNFNMPGKIHFLQAYKIPIVRMPSVPAEAFGQSLFKLRLPPSSARTCNQVWPKNPLKYMVPSTSTKATWTLHWIQASFNGKPSAGPMYLGIPEGISKQLKHIIHSMLTLHLQQIN